MHMVLCVRKGIRRPTEQRLLATFQHAHAYMYLASGSVSSQFGNLSGLLLSLLTGVCMHECMQIFQICSACFTVCFPPKYVDGKCMYTSLVTVTFQPANASYHTITELKQC